MCASGLEQREPFSLRFFFENPNLCIRNCTAVMAIAFCRLFKAFDSEAAQALILNQGGGPSVSGGASGKTQDLEDKKPSGGEERTSCALCDRANAKQRYYTNNTIF